MTVPIRDATAADLDAIVTLFNAPIPATTTTWRDHLADLEELGDWFAERQEAGDPVLVAELGAEVVGYACWARFRGGPRFPGYDATVEQTVHVLAGHHGRGIGRSLVDALTARARTAGVHVMVAGVDAENEASYRFHRALGYDEVARMPEVGRKFGRWLDLVLLQRILS